MCWKAILEALKPRPTIVAWLCEESGLLAGAKCTQLVARRYYVDPRPGEPEVPVDVCNIHDAPAPEPPEPQPEPDPVPPPPPPIPQADHTPPRTGMDFYQAACFPLSDIKRYLDDLVINGGSLIRFFGDFVWPITHPQAGWKSSLFRQVGWYTEHGGPFDGREYPLYTIAKSVEYGEPWNEPVWVKYRAIFTLCAERKIRVTWSVLDGCSMKNYKNAPDQTRYQPLLQCVQHHGAEGGDKTYTRMDGTRGLGYSIHTGGIYGGFGGDRGTMRQYLPYLYERAVRLLRSVPGLDWRINLGNEMERRREGDETQADVDKILHDWHDHFIRQLLVLGVRPDQIVVSITGTNSREAVSLPLVRRHGVTEQIHGPNSDTALVDFLSRFPGAEIDGDGQDRHATGYDNGMMRLPSLEQCRRMRSILKDRGLTYQTYNAHCEPAWGQQDIRLADWAEQRALAGK